MEILAIIFVIFILGAILTPKKSLPYLPDQKTAVFDPDKNQTQHAVVSGVYMWPNPGQFNFAIVGESNYQHTLKTIVKKQSEDKQIHEAHLVPEDDNEYDDKAVRVDIDGKIVGYLDRDSARSFRGRLSKNKLSGETTGCSAVIIGGHTLPSGKTASYGVWLDLKGFN